MSQPRKRGRPVKTDNVKNESLLVRLQPSEKSGFKKAAELAGVPLATWVRERLRQSAAKELESEGIQVPFYKHLAV